ncbi:hypothetical protein DRW03_21200 [Corallococcus sp. H22C18031201]|nr:hypothetical protein DRW03_21200 [Corallococcus sp. H22C18031201]
MPHDSSKTPPERRKAPAGSTHRIEGLSVSLAAWARIQQLAAQMKRGGIPYATRSGALTMLVMWPSIAAQVLTGGCRAYRCATCSTWLDSADEKFAHQHGHPAHQIEEYAVPAR